MLGVFVVAGCVNQQSEVAKYRTLINGPHPAAIPDYSNGLSLETALLLANRNYEQIAISGENYLQSLIDKDRAYSNFLPTISLAPQVSYTNKPSSGVSASGAVSAPITGGKTVHTDVPVAGGYQNFNLFGSLANLYRLAHTVDQQRALLFDMQQQILLETAQTYYAVLSAEQSVVVLRNSVKVQDEALKIERGEFRAGLTTSLAVAQIEAQDAATRAELTAAIAQAHTGRQTLEFMIGSPVMDVPLVDRLDVPNELLPMAQALAVAQDNRQDLAAARFAIQAARQNVNQQLAAYSPSVSLDVDYYFHRETVPSNIEWAGIFTANVPIFTGGLLYQNLRQAWSEFRQAWLQESYTSRQVREQVQQAYENVTSEARQLPDLRLEVASAQEALRQSQTSLQVGLATYLDLLTAQNALLSAQLSYTTAEFDYKVFYLDFLRAMGVLNRPSSPMPILQPLHEVIPPELITPGPVFPTIAPLIPATQPAPRVGPPATMQPPEVPSSVPSTLAPLPPLPTTTQ
ncbi:MAG TPA: TolC family protein [Tepidisphaeraceae bacterium]|jgi:outer membrane protein|nr:TolC family protein [Tepidisphaeraceae bacterium]